MKKILITAGPTWIKIDDVRVITTIFTGNTGIFLAKKFKESGFSVTLLINSQTPIEVKGIKVVPFRYFDELREAVSSELKRNHFDMIVHSAAVSDYKVKNYFRGKISSGKKAITLKLVPAEKLIKKIRKLARNSILVQFKLEVERKGLINKAFKSLLGNRSDLVVANAFCDLKKGYKAFIINKNKKVVELGSKQELFDGLHNELTGDKKLS